MKHLLLFFTLTLFFLSTQAFADKAPAPIPIIFDTDIGNDVDDALALGVIHALQSRGYCQLLAVTITKESQLAGKFVDCVNTFYGRGNIPIGIVHNGAHSEEGKYLRLVEQRDNNRLRYPHDFDPDTADHAVGVLRKTLAAAEDASVVIVQVGFSTNLARLLSSPPDSMSPLSGIQLIEKKVKLLSIMAGAFELIADANGKRNPHREYNVVMDLPSSKKLALDWPTPIVWSGYEIGLAVTYPATSIEQDYHYTRHHPLAEAYYLYLPPPHNRPSWDLTSVLYAVRPDQGYFDLSAPGKVRVADDGQTTFTAQADGKHRHLILTPNQKIRVREALVQLASQPPAKKE